ncbi:MAG: carbohydrate kinase [Acidobacteria bacterium]|nr:MAG: carbohydrate kinase [Acidobacteriota bacterium]
MIAVSIGEVLWDVLAGEYHLGGAPFNFAAHLRRLGHSVSFISGVGSDPLGHQVRQEMVRLGLSSCFINEVLDHPTGRVTVTLEAAGQPRFVIHRPAAYDFLQLTREQLDLISTQHPEWIYFGTLLQMNSSARRVTDALLASLPGAKRFYDVNLRPGSYTPELVHDLLSKATVIKLNDQEVVEVAKIIGCSYRSLEDFCRQSARAFRYHAVCVTRGAEGCATLIADDYLETSGYAVEVSDTVGAGDAFAAAFLHGLASGWRPSKVADFANRLGALVASRPGAIPDWDLTEVNSL